MLAANHLYSYLAPESNSEGSEDGLPDDSVSVLLTLVQNSDWAGTLARIASHPSETHAVGVQGRSPLHVACDHDAPAVVIQALLKAYPEASLMVGTSNMNPLHITCSSQHASVHVVRVLLEAGHPSQSSQRDVDGDTPLHAACRCGAPMEVLEVLLKFNPAMVHERDYEGLTPLLRLWVRYFVILGGDVIDGVKGPADLTGELGDAWHKTELLLRCAHYGSLLEEDSHSRREFRVVHAAAAVDCPRQVVKIAASVFAHQLMEKDENGLTPLLIAAQAPIFKVRDLSDEGYTLEDVIHGDENNSVDQDEAAAAQDASPLQPSVIEILLQTNVDAATSAACVPDPVGRLPLHLCLATGKQWNQGVKQLYQAFPDAVRVRDAQTKLYPFLLAGQGEGGDISTAYELLRLHPSLLEELNNAEGPE